jgi:acyl-CoA-dependent ceramide synthase
MDDFYIIKFAYHFYEAMTTSLFHRDRKDFSEFLLHHILTIVMVGYAYCTNIIPIGGPIMLVMDASDVFVALFKITVDNIFLIQYPAFIMMIVTWFYFRIWHFPIYLIHQIWV